MNNNSCLVPSNRKISVDQAFDNDADGLNMKNHQFVRLVAKGKSFVNCDFSFSDFDSVYLRNCSFDSCKFVGCKFSNSNLRGSTFTGCKFDYVNFSHTHVEPEILDSGFPSQENLQLRFARTLRLNFNQIGDADSANEAINLELESTRIHFYKAWRSREAYYRKKYPGLKRFGMYLKWARFVALDFFWGNGESPLKLMRSLAVFSLVVAIGDVVTFRNSSDFASYIAAIDQVPAIILGVVSPPHYSGLSLTLIATVRYVMLACLVSMLIKRLSKR